MPSNGITISVTAETNAGGRRHMEDFIAVSLSPNDELKEIPELKEQAFVGVFDGHGGKEAAKYVREKMWDAIQRQPKFRSHDVESVKEAIKDAYLGLHNEMVSHRPSWKRNKTGDLSTAGTTACTVIFRKEHIFVSNCGDSTAIMGIRNPAYGQPGEPPLIAKLLTKDHKPDDPMEKEAIEELGGKVMMSPKGVWRVVWDRERINTATGQKSVDHIPFLSVSRSLGDFWSYSSRTGNYVVSPTPDVFVHRMDLSQQSFVVLASDGLWNVMSPKDVVSFIYEYEQTHADNATDVVTELIKEALSRWERKHLQADNISVLVAFLSEEATPQSSPCKSASAPPTCATADNTMPGVETSRSDEQTPATAQPSLEPLSPLRGSAPPSSSSSSSSSPTKQTNSSPLKRSHSKGIGVQQHETKIRSHHHHHRHHKRHRSTEKHLARRELHKPHRRSASPLLLTPTISPPIQQYSLPTETSAFDGISSSSSLDPSVDSSSDNVCPPPPLSSPPPSLLDQEFSLLVSENDLVSSVQPQQDSLLTKRRHSAINEDLPPPKRPLRLTELSHEALLALRGHRLSTDSTSDSSSSGVCSDMESSSPADSRDAESSADQEEGMLEHASVAGDKNRTHDMVVQDEGCCCE